jgi:hypothetical protein
MNPGTGFVGERVCVMIALLIAGLFREFSLD